MPTTCPQHAQTDSITSGRECLVIRTRPLSRWEMQLPYRETIRQGRQSSAQGDLCSCTHCSSLHPWTNQRDRHCELCMTYIQHCQLMHVPRMNFPSDYAVIYTDAYFVSRNRMTRPRDQVSPTDVRTLENGWGAVCFLHGNPKHAAYFEGRLPRGILLQFRNAAFVSMMAPLIFSPCLNKLNVQCCDNEAARRALIKGVAKHQPLNCLIAAHWTWHNRKSISHRIKRALTKANVADPVSPFEDVEGFMQDWLLLHFTINNISKRCLRIIGDVKVACSLGFDDMPAIAELHSTLRKWMRN